MRVLSARGSELESSFAFGVVRQLFEPALYQASRRRAGGLGRPARPSWSSRCSTPRSRWSAWAPATPTSRACTACTGCARTSPATGRCCCRWTTRTGPTTRRCASCDFLTSRLEDLPVLLLVGTRPSEEALSDLLPMLASDPGARSLAPAPLSDAAVQRVGARSALRRAGRGRVLPRLPRGDQRQPAADERADPRGGLRADGAHRQRGRARGGAGPAGRLARGAAAPGPPARGGAGAGPRGRGAGRQRERHAWPPSLAGTSTERGRRPPSTRCATPRS